MAHRHTAHVLDLARRGAEVRLRDMEIEREYLFDLFPDLRTGLKEAIPATVTRHRRKKMGRALTADARKAISVRMKAYWANRRKGKKA